MPGDQDRVQRLAVAVHPAGDHADRLHRGHVQPAQVAEQPVLMDGQVLQHLLDREHLLPHRTNRTTCREIPRGRATSLSSGQSSSGVAQGRVISWVTG